MTSQIRTPYAGKYAAMHFKLSVDLTSEARSRKVSSAFLGPAVPRKIEGLLEVAN